MNSDPNTKSVRSTAQAQPLNRTADNEVMPPLLYSSCVGEDDKQKRCTRLRRAHCSQVFPNRGCWSTCCDGALCDNAQLCCGPCFLDRATGLHGQTPAEYLPQRPPTRRGHRGPWWPTQRMKMFETKPALPPPAARRKNATPKKNNRKRRWRSRQKACQEATIQTGRGKRRTQRRTLIGSARESSLSLAIPAPSSKWQRQRAHFGKRHAERHERTLNPAMRTKKPNNTPKVGVC